MPVRSAPWQLCGAVWPLGALWVLVFLMGLEASGQSLEVAPAVARAYVLVQRAQADSAVALLDTASVPPVHRPWASQARIEAYLQLGQWSAAYALLTQQPDGLDEHRLYQMARCAAHLGRPQQAVQHLRPYMQTKHRHGPKTLLADTALLLEGAGRRQIDELLDFEAWELDTDEAAYHLRFGRSDQALQLLQEVVLTKKYARAWQLIARIETQRQHHKAADNAYQMALRLHPQHTETAVAYAQFLLQRQKPKLALGILKRAFRHRPYAWVVYPSLAVAAHLSGDSLLAQRFVQYSVAYMPSNEMAWLQVAQMYEQMERYLEALRYYTKCLRANPLPEYYRQRGVCYVAARADDAALRDLGMAIDLNPTDAQALFWQAEVFFRQKNYTRACALWQQAARLQHPQAVRRLAERCGP